MQRIGYDMQPLIGKKSGIGWYTYNILKNIVQDEYILHGMCFDFLGMNRMDGKYDELKLDDIYVKKFFPSKVYRLISGYIPIRYDWFFPKGDIYHFFNFVAPPISGKKKVVITVHDMVYKVLPETVNFKTLYILKRDLKNSIKRADAIITVSQHSKTDLMKFHDVEEDKISIVNPGIDYDFYKKGQDIPGGIAREIRKKYSLPGKYILYLGTIEPRKNISSIVDAYENLPEKVKTEYKLVLAGGIGWKSGDILKKIEQTDSSGSILMPGYVDEEDKPYIYGMAAVFVFPSLYEGFGMPVIEAMASGTAVVTSNGSSLPEAGGDAALYSDAADINGISDNILKVLTDETTKKDLVQKGILQSQKFLWRNSANETLKVYRKLLGAK